MKKLPNYKYLLSSSLIGTALFFATATAAYASSGPVGPNELRAASGPDVGQVTLMWKRVDLNVTNYSLAYGTSSGKYTYGADKIGNIVTYTVKYLSPGQRYCFLLYPYLDNQISTPKSPELCETAASGATPVVGTAGPYGRNLLSAVAGPQTGQVTLKWQRFFPDTQLYNIVYGVKPGNYIYGVVNARDATNPNDSNFEFVVGSLQPGQRYYFALIPQVNGQGVYITAEVSQVAHW